MVPNLGVNYPNYVMGLFLWVLDCFLLLVFLTTTYRETGTREKQGLTIALINDNRRIKINNWAYSLSRVPL